VTILASGLITIRTHWLSSLDYAAQTQFELRSRLLPQNKATIVTCHTPHTGRMIHLTSPVINKKEIEGNYIPPMPGLKRGENWAWVNLVYDYHTVHARTLLKDNHNKKNQCVSTTQQYSSILSWTSMLDGGWWSMPSLSHSIPQEFT